MSMPGIKSSKAYNGVAYFDALLTQHYSCLSSLLKIQYIYSDFDASDFELAPRTSA